MLHIFRSVRELDYANLMHVYEQSNRESGARDYPGLAAAEQLLRAEQDFYVYLRESFFAEKGSLCAVWEHGGRYAAVLRMEPYRDGFLLTGLETAPADRCKGYATALVRAALAYMTQQGTACVYSHVDKNNAASLKVHKACGFRRILEHAAYTDGSVLQGSCTLCYEFS